MRLLGRGPDCDAVVGATIFRHDAAAFDRMRGAAMLPQILLEHMRRLAERSVGVAESHLVGGDDVGVELAADRGRCRRGGLAAVGGRRQHAVIDLDQGCRIRDVAIVGDHDATASPT